MRVFRERWQARRSAADSRRLPAPAITHIGIPVLMLILAALVLGACSQASAGPAAQAASPAVQPAGPVVSNTAAIPTFTAAPATAAPLPTAAPSTAAPLPTAAPSPTIAPTAVQPTAQPTTAVPTKPPRLAASPTATPGSSAAAAQPATPLPAQASLPVRLVFPGLKIDVPVQEMSWHTLNSGQGSVSEWLIPRYAAGHAVNSPAPGQPGNMVISGHNNIYGRVFLRISQAWPATGAQSIDAYTLRSSVLDGQKIQVATADGRTYDYAVTAFYRVLDSGVSQAQREANGQYIGPTEQTQLTLTTCWPPWSNTYRLIIVAQPVNQ